jgi:hypothetical protein
MPEHAFCHGFKAGKTVLPGGLLTPEKQRRRT